MLPGSGPLVGVPRAVEQRAHVGLAAPGDVDHQHSCNSANVRQVSRPRHRSHLHNKVQQERKLGVMRTRSSQGGEVLGCAMEAAAIS